MKLMNFLSPEHPDERLALGIWAGAVGVLVNLVLFGVKLAIGLISGSIAIAADAINNLSDAGSSVIAIVGFRMSAKPADMEHPFGHGRMEYVAGLVVAVIIVALGLDFLKAAVERIMHPSDIEIGWIGFSFMILTIFAKGGLFFFYRAVGKKINSVTLHAAAFDSLSDILTTSLVVVALLVGHFTTLHIDGVAGVLVSLFIIFGGIKVVKDTINPLLGECPDKDLVLKLREKLLENPDIYGIHDIIIHNYGPNRYFATAHAEVSKQLDALYIHELLEHAEVEIAKTLPVKLILHCDPFDTTDPEVKKWRARLENIVSELDPQLKLYDFRLTREGEVLCLHFHLLTPRIYATPEAELTEKIRKKLHRHHSKLELDIHYIDSYV